MRRDFEKACGLLMRVVQLFGERRRGGVRRRRRRSWSCRSPSGKPRRVATCSAGGGFGTSRDLFTRNRNVLIFSHSWPASSTVGRRRSFATGDGNPTAVIFPGTPFSLIIEFRVPITVNSIRKRKRIEIFVQFTVLDCSGNKCRSISD